jgi:Zn-dependent protease/CBS domain-containing protein
MFGKRIRLFRLLGFDVHIDVSWLIIAMLVSWSLASGVFPAYFEGLSTQAYWLMGIFGALGFFASIIFHELSHSVIARRFGLPIKGITLFIFGGVAEMEEEPASPQAEFYMAIAGPAASIFAGVAMLALAVSGSRLGWSFPVTGVVRYLGVINLVLAGFNLLPAFPLDGGRVLRAAIWRAGKDIGAATRTASRIGSGFGTLLIFAGVIFILSGSYIGGLWWIFIGIFLRSASKASLVRVRMKQALEGKTVRQLMKPEPVTVLPGSTINDLVEDFVYRHHFKMFPVSEDGDLQGCVTIRDIREIPREEWDTRTVEEISRPCSGGNTIDADADAIDALRLMRSSGSSRLMVIDRGRLTGIISLKDLLGFVTVRLGLEGNGNFDPPEGSKS